MKFIVFSLVISLLLSCGATRVKKTEIVIDDTGLKLQEKLDPFIKQIMKDHDVETSIAIGVTKGDKIIYAKAFGYANINTKDTATINTVYHMSSISKVFIATAIAKLKEQGKLNINDQVIKYLPYFKLKSPAYKEITILQLLTHRSGLPKNLRIDDWKNPIYTDDAVETFVRSAADAELEFAPGADYGYSDVGFITLGDIISKASGMNFEDYIQENIFAPAGMKNSTFLKPKTLPANWAAPHIIGTTTQVWKYFPYNRQYAPANALHSNVTDMCQWALLNLGHGNSKKNKIVDTATHNLIVKPWAKTPWGEHIGLSWFLQSYEGMKTIMHTGEDIGFESQIIMYPEEDISIVVMANRAYSRTARISNAIMEIIKDLKVKSYNISAKFPFCKEWEANGFESAKILWKKLLADTTDKYYANEWEMNIIGHGLIFTEEYEKAKAAFGFNIELYPNSANVYDSYGDTLLAEGDTTNAIVYFKKALAVDPNFEDPKPKLQELGVTILSVLKE